MVCHADARDAVAHGPAVRGRRAVSRSLQRRARGGRHRGHLPAYVRPHRAAALHHRRAPGAGRAGLRHLAVCVPAARPALPDCRRQPPALQSGRPGGAAPRLLGRYRGITGKAAAGRRADTLAARAFPRAPAIRRGPGMSTATAPKPAGAAIPSLIGWLLLTAVAAALGALASAPPAWLFGPVWSVLYLLMAVAAWRVGRVAVPRPAPALLLYAGQLALNALWSWLFFAWHLGAPACACIVVLWLMIAATVVLFGRRERLAAILLWPYLAWVSFAGLLCLSIWQRNPVLLG